VFSASLLGVNGILVARHVRRRLLIFSVSTLGFFISSFSAVLAFDFIGHVVSVLDGYTIEVLHNHHEDGPKSPTGISKEDERMSTGEGSYCFPLVIGSPSADPR
jgi:hypothetical protein